MKRILLIYIQLIIGIVLFAKPAKHIKVTFPTNDGTKIPVLQLGDEFCQYYLSDDGKCMLRDKNGLLKEASTEEVQAEYNSEYNTYIQSNGLTSTNYYIQNQKLTSTSEFSKTESRISGLATQGSHTHLLILVDFTNQKFSSIGTKDRFEEFANGDNYNFQGATGSAKKYFEDQSLKKYSPTFDIVGPVTVDTTYQYYGNNQNKKSRIKSLVEEAVKKAYNDSLITDPSKYDNDGDGFIDLVYVITAGYSAAEDSKVNGDYPWPHQWSLTSAVKIGNTAVSKYAFSTELQGKCTDTELVLDGIGSIAHEFGHALGLPDFYCTASSTGCYGMDYWSVMDQGCYINDGKTPPSYTAHERAFLGWCELDTIPNDTDITLEPFGKGNKAYVCYNPDNKDEYLTFEYHHPDGCWDEYWGSYSLHGMMILHTDYNAGVWWNNTVNNDPEHQRCTLMPADGELLPWDSTSDKKKWYESFINDIFPGANDTIDTLNKDINPALKFFTGSAPNFEISNIKEDVTNSKLSFHFVQNNDTVGTSIKKIVIDSESRNHLYDIRGSRIKGSINDAAKGFYIYIDTEGKKKIISKQ